MSETTHIYPEDLLNMLKRAERLGAYKTLNWLNFEFTENMTAEDIVELVESGIAAIGEELEDDFKREHFISTSMEQIIQRRLKQKETA